MQSRMRTLLPYLVVVAYLALVILTVLMLAGCAAAVALTPTESARLAGLRAFSDRVTAVYGMRPVSIRVADLPDGWAASHAVGGWITLAPKTLGFPRHHLDKVVAHELGHYVLRHSSPPTVEQELAADAEAVKILQVGLGMAEADAFRVVLDYFCLLERRPPAALPPGHLMPREKMADLKRHYPGHDDADCPR